MKRRIALFLSMIMILMMAIPQIAAADSKTEDHVYKFQTGILPYSAQMEDEASVRVTWHNFTSCKGYVLSWKKAGSEQKAQSIRIDDPKTSTYVVNGLEAKTDYEFSIKGILTAADGNDLFTEPWTIEGSTYIRIPKYTGSRSDGTSIESYWQVKEMYSNLKIYRAESKDGPYDLVGTLKDGGDFDDGDAINEAHAAQYVRFMFNNQKLYNCAVEPGKTYYYKAQAEGTVNGKTYSSEMSEVVALDAKNEEGRFVTTLLNKKNAYTKQIKIKLTSDEGNYTTYLKSLKSLTYDNGKKSQKRIVTKAEYSRGGKKYYTLKNKNISLKAGESIYLRITTKNRFWISKSLKQGAMDLNVKYDRPKPADKADNALLHISIFDSHYKNYTGVGGTIAGYEQENPSPVTDPFYKAVYGTYDSADLKAEKKSDTSVLLSWKSVGSSTQQVESYEIRYGTSKNDLDIKEGKPIVVPKYQVEYLLDGLEKGKTYYFIVRPSATPDGSDQYEEEHYIRWDGNKFEQLHI